MASSRWPTRDGDGRSRVAVRFAGGSPNPMEEVQRLVASWEAYGVRTGSDPTADLERPPWVEAIGRHVEVVFETRPGNGKVKKWLTSFFNWVETFGGEMHPAAVVDRVGGTDSGIYWARRKPMPSGVGPVNDADWVPGEGAESPPMLYREMMNRAVSPLMRSLGYKREGQAFEKQRNGYNAYVGFQKDRHNTKLSVSFTINLSVVNPEVLEEQMQGFSEAMSVWGRDIVLIPKCGQWGDRIGHFMGTGDYWWTIRSREEMEDVSRSVISALRDRALPLMERELDKPITFPTYVIETRGSPRGTHLNEAGVIWRNVGGKRLWPVPGSADSPGGGPGVPDLTTPPHTWPHQEEPTVRPLPKRSTVENPDITPFTAVADGPTRHALLENEGSTMCGLDAAGLRRLPAFYVLSNAQSCASCREAIEAEKTDT